MKPLPQPSLLWSEETKGFPLFLTYLALQTLHGINSSPLGALKELFVLLTLWHPNYTRCWRWDCTIPPLAQLAVLHVMYHRLQLALLAARTLTVNRHPGPSDPFLHISYSAGLSPSLYTYPGLSHPSCSIEPLIFLNCVCLMTVHTFDLSRSTKPLYNERIVWT